MILTLNDFKINVFPHLKLFFEKPKWISDKQKCMINITLIDVGVSRERNPLFHSEKHFTPILDPITAIILNFPEFS
jgi:hypothetical protein